MSSLHFPSDFSTLKLMATVPAGIYPKFSIVHITKPTRFWAFPLFGGLIKIIILIPVFFELIFVSLYTVLITMVINSLIVLFTGKYWRHAFTMNLAVLRLSSKVHLYFIGLTNKYPGFGFQTNGFELEATIPQVSNRMYAIPFFGGLARFILLVPYFIFTSAVSQGAILGVIISSFWVLFKGYYPATSYELARDGLRLSLSANLYFAGISDKYPNFYISMDHQTLKLLLIIFAISGGGMGNYNSDADSNNSGMYKDSDIENMQYAPDSQLEYNGQQGTPSSDSITY